MQILFDGECNVMDDVDKLTYTVHDESQKKYAFN